MTGWDAVVLAGGGARRLGGVAKPGLEVGGVPLLSRVLAATAGADRTVVVGPPVPATREVHWVLEEPPGGGPVAALAAGLVEVTAAWVAVLAADLPFLQPGHLEQLRAAGADRDGALAVDATGRDQLLLGVWSAAALRRRLPGDPVGCRLRDVLAPLDVVRVPLAGTPPPWWDCDTPEELATARGWA